MADNTTLLLTFTAISCYRSDCGITFALPEWMERSLRDSHDTFYCPHGHAQRFVAKSAAEREKQLREEAERKLVYANNRAERAVRRLSAKKGAMTRLKNRVAHGVCPCCHRTFPNLTAHMKGQHPAYVESAKRSRP